MALSDHPMWRRPQHHTHVENAGNHVHWVELFYDLIHVVTIFLLGNFLAEHHGWGGFGLFCLMFVVLFFAWGEISVYHSIYVSTDFYHRMTMSVAIMTVMIMAAAIPSIGGGGWPFFAFGFAMNRFVIAALYFRARRVDTDPTGFCREMVRNFTIFGIIFAISAFLPRPLSYWVFALGMLATQVIYMLPWTTVLRFELFAPRIDHLVERFALLTLIVIGESFFKLVTTLADKGIYKVSPDVLANFLFGGFGSFIMCWVYFDTVGFAKPKDQSVKRMVIMWMAHMMLVLCAVMVGVALTGAVKVGFFEPYPFEYGRYGIGGLAGYIACIWILQNNSEYRVADDFTGPALRLFGIGLVLSLYFYVEHVPSIVSNLIWSTALMSQLFVPLITAWIKFSREERAEKKAEAKK